MAQNLQRKHKSKAPVYTAAAPFCSITYVKDHLKTHSLAAHLRWLAAVQSVQRKDGLACLTPKAGLVTAESVERVSRQIGKTQKAACEIQGAGIAVHVSCDIPRI